MKIRLLISVVVLGFGSVASAGSITYQINDYPTQESGYKISGSITTDATIGSLSSSDITAWTWTLSDSSGSPVYGTSSSTDSGAGIYLHGTVTASATQITMTSPSSGYNELSFYANGGVYLYWYRGSTNGDDFEANIGAETFAKTSGNPPGLALPDATTWVIATAASVPEPSTFITAALGGLGLIVHNRLRRRNSTVS